MPTPGCQLSAMIRCFMVVQNPPETRDIFATNLVTRHKLSLRNLQLALERSAETALELDIVLREMQAVPDEVLATAASNCDYQLTSEQPALPQSATSSSREFNRHNANLAVKFPDWGNLEAAFTNNISRGGMGVTLPLGAEAPPVDTTLTLALTTPDGQTIKFKGRVCYCRDGTEFRHLGLQLHHESSEEVLEIDKLLRAHQS